MCSAFANTRFPICRGGQVWRTRVNAQADAPRRRECTQRGAGAKVRSQAVQPMRSPPAPTLQPHTTCVRTHLTHLLAVAARICRPGRRCGCAVVYSTRPRGRNGNAQRGLRRRRTECVNTTVSTMSVRPAAWGPHGAGAVKDATLADLPTCHLFDCAATTWHPEGRKDRARSSSKKVSGKRRGKAVSHHRRWPEGGGARLCGRLRRVPPQSQLVDVREPMGPASRSVLHRSTKEMTSPV